MPPIADIRFLVSNIVLSTCEWRWGGEEKKMDSIIANPVKVYWIKIKSTLLLSMNDGSILSCYNSDMMHWNWLDIEMFTCKKHHRFRRNVLIEIMHFEMIWRVQSIVTCMVLCMLRVSNFSKCKRKNLHFVGFWFGNVLNIQPIP